MFPKNPYAPKWTMKEIDEMDMEFFNDLMQDEEEITQDKEVYLSELW